MGESKRRKQLDPSYGKVYHLPNDTLKAQQAERVVTEMFACFSEDLKQLMIATSFPDHYSQTTERIQHWFNLRLSQYAPDDRCFIAQYIFTLISHLEDAMVTDGYNRQHPVSPLIICCFLKVTKNYFEPDTLLYLKQKLQRDFPQLSPQQKGDSLSQSFIDEIQLIIP